MVKFWQLTFEQKIEDIMPLIVPAFTESILTGKQELSLEQFKEGYLCTYTGVGRIAFVITETENEYYQFKDFLGNNIDNSFDNDYVENYKVYVSKNIITPSQITFKIEKP